MDKLKEYEALKKVIAKLERKRDEIKGILKHIKQELKEEFDCDSLEEAEKLKIKLEKKYNDELEQFRRDIRSWLAKNKQCFEFVDRRDIKILQEFAGTSDSTKSRKGKTKGSKEKHRRT